MSITKLSPITSKSTEEKSYVSWHRNSIRGRAESKLQRWLSEEITKSDHRRNVISSLGQFWCRRVGWRLNCGPRILIEEPHEFIQSEILLRGTYEPEVSAAILAIIQPRDLFVDIGANIGVHSLTAAYQGACVHAFEPVPRLVKKLKKNIAVNRLDTRILVFESAISDKEGETILYVASRIDDGSHSLIEGVPATSISPIIVKTTTLDKHLEKYDRVAPTMLKIDVEGAEAWVLDGACRVLTHDQRPIIIIETGDRLAKTIGESAKSVLGRLISLNFRIFQWRNDIECYTEIGSDGISSQLFNYLAVPAEFPDVDELIRRIHTHRSALR